MYHTAGRGSCLPRPIHKSFLVQDDDHFHVLCRYVESNATARPKLVARAGGIGGGGLCTVWFQAERTVRPRDCPLNR